MSFILDALKKSESDRQRQTGPALFEVKIAAPKARFPLWAVAIAGLLAINMLVVGWLLLRRTGQTDIAAPASNNSAMAAASPQSGAPPQTSPDSSAPGAPQYRNSPRDNGQGYPNAPPPDARWSANNQPSGSNGGSRAGTPGPGADNGVSTSNSPGNPNAPPADARWAGDARPTNREASNGDVHEPTLAGGVRDSAGSSDPGSNPDDYAPATDPGSPLFKGRVRRGTESGLQLYQDAALKPGANLPPLRLDLHVYAAKPQDRFALINMHKLHEGDSLADGVRVEDITPDGVVVSHNGSKYLLPRD